MAKVVLLGGCGGPRKVWKKEEGCVSSTRRVCPVKRVWEVVLQGGYVVCILSGGSFCDCDITLRSAKNSAAKNTDHVWSSTNTILLHCIGHG